MSGVQSIQRAFTVLRELSQGAAGVSELAERSGIPKSTIARILGALEAEGAVEQVESWGEYRLGPALNALAGSSGTSRSMLGAARPYLWSLVDQTGETCGVSILEDGNVFYLDHAESLEEVQVRSWTGERVPAHLVPSGIVLLAHLPAEELDAYLAGPLVATTPASVIDPEQLRHRLIGARERGYEWVMGEFDTDLNSVAAPVVNSEGVVLGAIHIHGPAYRFPQPGDADAVARCLTRAVERLSQHLN